LYAATTDTMAASAFMTDFLGIVRTASFRNLQGLLPLQAE
jgi:hypothetical protein